MNGESATFQTMIFAPISAKAVAEQLLGGPSVALSKCDSDLSHSAGPKFTSRGGQSGAA